MTTRATEMFAAGAEALPYLSFREYLVDELALLDLRLRRAMLRRPIAAPADPLTPFRGLVISDAEVSQLLSPAEADHPEGLEEQSLTTALRKLQCQAEERRSAIRQSGAELLLPRLSRLFGLNRFEEECLVICLATELDSKYGKIYAYLQDDATARQPSVGLVLELLCESDTEKPHVRAAFESCAPLVRFRLLQVRDRSGEGAGPLLSRRLQLDDRVGNFLMGSQTLDPRLERIARLFVPAVEPRTAAPDELLQRMLHFLRTHFTSQESTRNVFLHLQGTSRAEMHALVKEVCAELRLPQLSADVDALRSSGSFDENAWLLGREAALQSAALCLEHADGLLADPEKHHLELRSLSEATATFSRLTFLLGARAWNGREPWRNEIFLPITVPSPDFRVSSTSWKEALQGTDRLTDDVSYESFAGKFRFGRSQIQNAIAASRNVARWRDPENWRITRADLLSVCRASASPRLGTLAQKIEPKYTWQDIVLPPDQLSQLKELCQQATYKHRVYGDWGFDRKLSLGKGLNALFSGPPGTGKTMAAEVIANALQLDLFRIDLSQVVSKYIGETEKNLHQIFLEAQTGSTILFFDEADALFGKRSDVKDAHDRYANIEIGYLLQKMEEYEGVAILATNLRQHIDDAFLRRMNFVVEFPFPDTEYRKRIWQVIFPQEAPVSDQVDFDLLASEIKLPGGNIKNIALGAAFYAAAGGGKITPGQLWHAARREHQKLGRTWEAGS